MAVPETVTGGATVMQRQAEVRKPKRALKISTAGASPSRHISPSWVSTSV